MEKTTNKKRILISIFILIIAIILLFLSIFHSQIKEYWNKTTKPEKPQEYITVFVHGAFNSVLGLFDTSKVIKDDLQGTKYKKLVSQLRKDSHFFIHQPILEKGLIPIKPSFNLPTSSNNKFAAYPIIKAYDTICKTITQKKERNYFYTFGWSGLLSQTQRRTEAIRFYNSLCEELEKLQNKGINPKIRIICHSHGGNISLNLAAINTALDNLNNPENINNIAENNDEKEALLKMLDVIKGLPEKESLGKHDGQKRFAYLPTRKNLKIDTLVMYGTPIQPETENFALNETFDKIFHFYSEEDSAQSFDWVSTKRYYSDQRFNVSLKGNNKKVPKIVQAKIMIDRKINKLKSNLDNRITTSIFSNNQKNTTPTITATLQQDKTSTATGFWNWLISSTNIFGKKSNDPSHAELWFADWYNKSKIQLSPLPTAILTSLFCKLIEESTSNAKIRDIDLNVSFSDKKINVYLLKHGALQVQNKISINRNLIEKMKEAAKKWKPENFSLEKEFNLIRKYSSNF